MLSVWLAPCVPAAAADIPSLLTREHFFFQHELYRYDTDWDEDWYGRDLGYRMTVGSVSADSFALDLDLKLHYDLAPYLWFDYRLRREESWLEDRETQLGAFGGRWRSWLLGVTGLLKGEKGYSVGGLYLGVEPEEGRRLVCRVLWPGLWFNDKGPKDERYLQAPFEVYAEGVWTWSSVSVFGEARVGREWVLETADGVESGRDLSGQLTVLARHKAREFALEIQGRDSRNSIAVSDTPEHAAFEALRFVKGVLQASGPVARRWQLTARAGAVSVRGEDVDETDPPGRRFSFTRLDWIGTVEATRAFSEADRLRVGVSVGRFEVDSGESTTIRAIDGNRLFLKVEYSRRFGTVGDLVVGTSFNVTESVFGGGNVRFRVTP